MAQVLRSGEELEYEIEMQPLQTLVPVHKYDQLPSYFIYAGGCCCATSSGESAAVRHFVVSYILVAIATVVVADHHTWNLRSRHQGFGIPNAKPQTPAPPSSCSGAPCLANVKVRAVSPGRQLQ